MLPLLGSIFIFEIIFQNDIDKRKIKTIIILALVMIEC